MNERIRELSRRVVGKRRDDAGPIWLVDEQLEKFAELIIRECMKLNHDILCEDDPNYLDQVYKEHFGVKE